MKLTVIVTTFNHEPFIAQALDSVLQQVTSFDFELIVGDDASTDGTRRILERSRAGHPDRIRLVLPAVNQGNNGNTLARLLLAQARGEYVAWLDGDDYWLVPEKLQCQVDYLEVHQDVSICCHRAYNLYPDGTARPYEDNFEYEVGRRTFQLTDILFQNFLPTCSIVFRRRFLPPLPGSYERMPSADWFLNVLLAGRGPIAYLDPVWGVRRVHANGVISAKPQAVKIAFNITCVKTIDAHFRWRYHRLARARLAYLHWLMARQLVHDGASGRARWHALRSLMLRRRGDDWPWRESLGMTLGSRLGARVERLFSRDVPH